MDNLNDDPGGVTGLSMDSGAREVAVEQANRWLARFAPIVHRLDSASVEDSRKRLAVLQELKRSAPDTLRHLQSTARAEDSELTAMLQTAIAQMDGVESTLRSRLGAFAPGDPEAKVDLAALRHDLAAVAARHELEQSVGPALTIPATLDVKVSDGNLAGAGCMGLFAFSWLSFTTVHAVFMIGGMVKTFGPIGLGLLGFYAIFFGAGFAMAYGAYQMLAKEDITLEGRRLMVRRTVFGKVRVRLYELAADCHARVEQSQFRSSQNNSRPSYNLVLQTAEGKEIKLGGSAPVERLRDCAAQMNQYLKVAR